VDACDEAFGRLPKILSMRHAVTPICRVATPRTVGSNVPMLLIDRYILRTLIAVSLAVIGMVTILLTVAMVFEKLPDILDRNPPANVVIGFFLCSLPWRLVQVVPLMAVLSVLMAVGILARSNEILSMLTSGVSVVRLSQPVLGWAVALVGTTMVANETVVPGLAAQSRLYELQIEGRDVTRMSASRNVVARGRDHRFFLMPLFAAYDNRMISPLIVDLSPDHSGVRRRVEASSAELISNNPEQRYSLWRMQDAREWIYDQEGRMVSYRIYPGLHNMEFEEDLHILLSQDKEPEEMNMGELAGHVRLLRERDQPVAGLTTDLYLKTGFPMATMFLVLIAFSYGIRMRPGNLMMMMSRGLGWAFGFYGLAATARGLGFAGVIPPLFAAYLPLVILVGAAAIMMGKSARWHG
jgi:lipopolysaccharide export system permease protein